jgi:hypothetical protein
MAERPLPAQFQEFEPFLNWALATERERTAKRQTTSMAESKAFYNAMVARLGEVLNYLNDFPQENIPAT